MTFWMIVPGAEHFPVPEMITGAGAGITADCLTERGSPQKGCPSGRRQNGAR
jgi:hypothetical protein